MICYWSIQQGTHSADRCVANNWQETSVHWGAAHSGWTLSLLSFDLGLLQRWLRQDYQIISQLRCHCLGHTAWFSYHHESCPWPSSALSLVGLFTHTNSFSFHREALFTSQLRTLGLQRLRSLYQAKIGTRWWREGRQKTPVKVLPVFDPLRVDC